MERENQPEGLLKSPLKERTLLKKKTEVLSMETNVIRMTMEAICIRQQTVPSAKTLLAAITQKEKRNIYIYIYI
jgi:hypothetical protein